MSININENFLNYLNSTTHEDTYYTILVTILSDVKKLSTMTISEVADACFVSAPTITRFSHAFGFKNFHEMKAYFLEYPNISTYMLFHMNKPAYEQLSTQPDVFLSDYVKQISYSLSQSIASFDIAELDSFLQDIHQHNRIILLAFETSFSLALTLQSNLLRYGKLCVCPSRYELQEQQIDLIDDKDLVIFISCYGNYLNSSTKLIQKVAQKKAKSVLLTQNASNPIVNTFDQVISFAKENQMICGPYIMNLGIEYLVRRYSSLYSDT